MNCPARTQAAGPNATKEQSRRVDGAFLAVGALNDVLRSTVRAQASTVLSSPR